MARPLLNYPIINGGILVNQSKGKLETLTCPGNGVKPNNIFDIAVSWIRVPKIKTKGFRVSADHCDVGPLGQGSIFHRRNIYFGTYMI